MAGSGVGSGRVPKCEDGKKRYRGIRSEYRRNVGGTYRFHHGAGIRCLEGHDNRAVGMLVFLGARIVGRVTGSTVLVLLVT